MAKRFALMLGGVLLVVGMAGWLTGGHDHELVVFGINMAHNMVHVLSGALAIAASFAGERPAKLYCAIFGAIYALVGIAGLLNISAAVDLLNLNLADNVLHLGIAAGCLLAAKKSTAS